MAEFSIIRNALWPNVNSKWLQNFWYKKFSAFHQSLMEKNVNPSFDQEDNDLLGN